jgi:GNAT superfamily N-acetyltransferase
MDNIAARLEVEATPAAPPLVLRPWGPADAADLVELTQDRAVRGWTSAAVDDEAGAAHARGRGIAPRALRALTEWAFATFTGDGLARLELLHQVDNAASCRVAQKSGYELATLLPAAPPAFPLSGHVHVRSRSVRVGAS